MMRAMVSGSAPIEGSPLVVIGSSAGGIEALSRVVRDLASDFKAAVIVAQHLDPRRPSHLPEILARHAALPVRVAATGDRLEGGVIHVVPPNRLVEVVEDTIRLRPHRSSSTAPSIDRLLASAAKAYGERLTAVILTGTGSDGAAGAWDVKRAGGTVVVENPATAMFASMPASVSPSIVDATADLDAIAGVLTSLVEVPDASPDSSAGASGSDPDGFGVLLERIRDRSGIDYGAYKPATIRRRVRGRVSATGSPSVAAYAALVERDPVEYDRLIDSLLIKVTEFFRDGKLWDELRSTTLPAVIQEARLEGREVRIWSAGCSTGEEAYSLAISVAEAALELGQQPEVRIFGTDVDRAAIDFARRGVYPPGALRNVPAPLRARYFTRTPAGFEVERRIRARMVFGEHDLSTRVPFPRIDLLLCRNVLIYFTVPLQRVALETFAYSLRAEGRLVLGSAETVAALPGPYAVEHARLRIYRRLPGRQLVAHPWPKVVQTARDPAFPIRPATTPSRDDDRPADVAMPPAEGVLLALDVGVVVVDPHYDIVRINTAARRMLGIHGSAFEQDFVHLADVLPSSPVRTAIDAALKGKTSQAVYEVEATDLATDAPRHLEVTAKPLRDPTEPDDVVIIELHDVSRVEQERRAHARTRQRLDKAAVLNDRLLRANDELSALIADLRLANKTLHRSSEDAQAGREEVETLNEEFQATNEELETLNEELTATVEELRIANEDLAARTDQLRVQAMAMEVQKRETEEEHDRLGSILASIGDAVVAVDHEGQIVATNTVYDRLFGGPTAEIPSEDVTGLPFPPEDRPQQRAARGERFRVEFAVSDEDGKRRWFEAVAEPLTVADRTWGGVVSIRDISERTMRLSLERLMAAAGHELKTPTAALHNYLQLVERRLASGDVDEAATFAARAMAQAIRLSELVERLYDISRIQIGRLDIVSRRVDLVTIVGEAVEVASVLPQAPSIRFGRHPASLMIQGDAGRLEQVFLNLLSNAIDHATGTDTVDVAIHRVRGRAEVSIRDTGPGIAAEDVTVLFDAYTRVGHPRESGLGLGLFVAREIVVAHGGTITAESTIGVGTTFTVSLPALTAAPKPASPAPPRAAGKSRG
jgi:two-component system CheB/CheR fusion protein